ncbi:MAG: threonyl-tRNA synthetase [Patescibacteria group bacterium]|jgi:threonyl-tRNA synthetase|nr:threonyl-tRNA synthetase [Patescibacteria group bacterium]
MLSPMETNIENKRHTLAHLLASAVLELYPNTKNTIGPAIDNGFYYDFEFPSPITDSDLEKIEKKMKDNLSSWEKFSHEEKTKEEAEKYFSQNPYKLELINEIVDKGEKITFYTCGNFTDLCRGGHTENPAKEITTDSFKLSRIAGAYWRGDEKNKMLTRIYGLAFNTKEELEAYEVQQEEARKRDHKILGPALKLFTLSPLIGSGLPLMQPKGMVIRKEIEDFLWQLHKGKGYSRVWTPHIAKEALYETSGHAAKFGDELFRVQGKEEKFIMKPMNCPHHMQIFADNQFSYKDMPVRYFEPATIYRDEKSGQLGGLTRVRAITQDDGHLFCAVSQIEEEAGVIVDIIKKFYETFGMIDEYFVRLSLRGEDKSAYLGSDEVWNKAEATLKNICETKKLPYKEAKNEAAFYGPKLDFMFKDAIGREWQLATIQCDFNLPERFNLSFVNNKGEKERPVVIHRAISGSLERFMGVLIEHFAGAFPLWLSPVQVKIVPIGENEIEYAKSFTSLLAENDIRYEIDESNESLGKKIRNAKMEKVPYVAVIGKKEVESKRVTLEGRTEKFDLSLDETISKLAKEIKEKSL